MKKTVISFASELRYVQIIDKDGFRAGKVADVQFSGQPGKELKVNSLLVGPIGDYPSKSGLFHKLLNKLLGQEQVITIPWVDVKQLKPLVTLEVSALNLGLGHGDIKFKNLIQKLPRG